jgi:serine/threonine protein kinase
MEGRAKVTKDVLCEEARFILANVLAEGRYGRQNRVADIRRICEGAVTIPFQEYVGFLEAAGYLLHDRQRDTLDVTPDGEKVVTGERVAELMDRAVAHFKATRRERERAAQQAAARQQSQAVASPPAASGPASTSQPVPGPPSVIVSGVVSSPVPVQVSSGPVPMSTSSAASGAARLLGGRFERLAPIGSGGIGSVYRARQVQLDRVVALKEISDLFSAFVDDQRREIVRRFADVVRSAAQLSHPHILAVHDVSTEGELPFVVTEYMPHGSLRRIISDAEDIPLPLVVRYWLQTLHALRAAHEAGVVHRGLKPENLLIDAHGNIKVSDFGMARIVERDQAVIRQAYVGLGAVAYMAPELFSDPQRADAQTDIYALGIIFYEMLTRRVPGRRAPMPSQVNDKLPKGIDDIFDRMTSDERTGRYTSVAQIFDDIRKIEGVSAFLTEHYTTLFDDNLWKRLKFRSSAVVENVVNEASAATQVPGGEERPGNASSRRPYSVQQRMKSKTDQ